jgi:hypothetical protein
MNLRYKGKTYTDKDMLTAHAVMVAQLVGKADWAALDYVTNINALVAWLSVLEASATKMTVTEAMEEVQSLPLNDLLNCLSEE